MLRDGDVTFWLRTHGVDGIPQPLRGLGRRIIQTGRNAQDYGDMQGDQDSVEGFLAGVPRGGTPLPSL
jgi:hypothetical protein